MARGTHSHVQERRPLRPNLAMVVTVAWKPTRTHNWTRGGSGPIRATTLRVPGAGCPSSRNS
eukprot:2605140-Amphidinium_carterae.1